MTSNTPLKFAVIGCGHIGKRHAAMITRNPNCKLVALFDKNMESSMTIIAENGTVKIGGQYMNEVSDGHIKDYSMPKLKPTNPSNDYFTYKDSAKNHHFIYKNVVDVMINSIEKITKTEEGLMIVDIIERMYASNN